MKKARVIKGAAALALGVLLQPAFSPALAHEGEDHQPAAQATALSAEARAVNQVMENYARAMNAKDLARIKPLLVPGDGFSYFEGSFVNVGWQSYYDHMAPEVALFDKPDYRVSNLRPFVSGDMAFVTFDWSLVVTIVSEQFEGGRHPVAMRGKGTAVMSRMDGGWKIRHLHTVQAPARREGEPNH